jgi:predicted ATP-grasp superfamily ATP-dependent carboligase
MDALVTDVHSTWALAGLRALGHGGLRVLAAGPRGAAGRFSRLATATAAAPDSARDPGAFALAIGRLVQDNPEAVVYPGQEEAIDALYAPAAPPMRLPYPGLGPLEALRDKARLAALADEAGVASPRTLAQLRAGELPALDLDPPFVVKAARPGGKLSKTKIVDTRDGLAELAGSLPADEPLLVQERADGPLTGLALVVARDGRPVARFQQVALRTWPPQAGGSSLAVSVVPDEELVARAARVLASAGYWGLAQMQFLRTGRGPALIDVNPRFYGSMALALASGVNLGAAWHAAVIDEAAPEPEPYRLGVTYRSLEADITAAFRGSPRFLLQHHARPRVGSIWAADDPLASAVAAGDRAWARVRRRLPGR